MDIMKLKPYKFTQDYVLCAAPSDDEGREACLAYIKRYGLTKDDVMLLKTRDSHIVRVRAGVELELKEATKH